MIVKVHEHKVEIIKTPVNEQEVNVTKCTFEFDETIPNNYVKKAFFTLNGNAYEQTIVNNECDIPNEVLSKKGSIELGVVAYKVENEELIQRFNPSPDYFDSWTGSLKEAENTEPITPTDKEQIESAIAQLENDVEELDNTKQDTLVSGENIKTINNESLLGNGNINLNDTYYTKSETYNKTEIGNIKSEIENEIPTKISELDNDLNFIDKSVDNLDNYTKTSDLPDFSTFSLITETGSKIDLEINSSTYVLTAKLYDKNNTLISTSSSIDLPLETMVVGASYDSYTKEIILTLKNGQEVRFSVADLVSGLQPEITPSNKLASDLVDDTNQNNKFISQSEKAQITTNATNIAGIKNGTTINNFAGVESALNGKEDKSNKVNSIDSTSTDTQYPSAKCMYDSQVSQDNEISDLQSENDYLNSIINQLPKVSSQGTILTLNNTIKGRMNIELGTSELEQESTNGYQLLKPLFNTETKNGVTITNNGDGTYTLNGTPSAATYFVFPIDKWEDFGESGDYYFSCNIFTNLNFAAYYSNSELLFWKTANGVFTLTNTVERFRFQIGCLAGVTYNNVVIKPMINKGTTALPFEKYTGGIPSPNPQYPQTIHTISGSNTIKVEGKNILTEQPTPYTATAQYSPLFSTDFQVNLKSGENYVLSLDTENTAINCYFQTTTGINLTYKSFTCDGTRKYVNFTATQDLTSISRTIVSRSSATSTTSAGNCTNVMILKGTASETPNYTPYVSQEQEIDLGDIEYCEIGDYKDEFVRDNESNWGIRKNIGKVVLDGSENWSKTSDTNVSVFTTAISGRNTSISSSSISDYFKYQFANNVGAFYFGSASYDTCAFCMENTYTIETFKTWLGTHNVSVYIILATPTYTAITGTLAEQLENIYQYLLSYKGQTNIYQINNDLPFNISASALLDLNTLVGE